MEFRNSVDKLVSEIIAIRRDIHAHPELGFEEHRTSKLICDYFKKLGIEHKIVAKTGVVGTVFANNAHTTIAIRAEMDALPIQEQSKCDYTSENQGIMHACGHDGIVAIGLGLLNLVSNSKDQLKCNVKFLFQPAEEKGHGAKVMIDEGVLSNPKVDRIIIYHINTSALISLRILIGTIAVATGGLKIDICGKSCHWTYKDKGISAINIAAKVINAIDEFNKSYKTEKPFIIGVGTIHGGTRSSIVPETVEMLCTLRADSREEQYKIYNRIQNKLENIASENKAVIDMKFTPGYPALKNIDPKLVELARVTGEQIFGQKKVVVTDIKSLAGDDAAYYFEKVPGVKLSFCAGFEKKENFLLHNSRFDFDDKKIIPLALKALYGLMMRIK